MRRRSLKFSAPAAYSIAAVLSLVFIFISFLFAKWCLANAASLATDQKEIAEYAVSISPSDPQNHFASAVLLEKTFLPDDYERSLLEYEAAAALSPSSYLIWLDYGRALDRHGDEERAEAAFRRASELAPNYSSTKWALGNFLLRNGKPDEGFAQLREAVDSNPALADATVQSAYSWFTGDINKLISALGKSPVIQASLIKLLVREKRSMDGFAVWQEAAHASDKEVFTDAATLLLSELISEKRYGNAYAIYSASSEAVRAELGQVTNGSFEERVRMQGTPVFDWQIDDSPKSQVAIIEGQKRSGNRSLRLLFNLTEARDFRGISQYVAVQPGKKYVFESYYKSDLKTSAPIKWEIVDAADGKMISSTNAFANNSDWSLASAEFAAPVTSEAVIIRLARDCPSAICALSGSIFVDDVSIQPR